MISSPRRQQCLFSSELPATPGRMTTVHCHASRYVPDGHLELLNIFPASGDALSSNVALFAQ